MKEADLEVSKLSKQNTSLRETVQRQEREKMLQEAKWKGHLKVGGLKTKVEDGKQELLQMGNKQLRGGGEAVAGGCEQSFFFLAIPKSCISVLRLLDTIEYGVPIIGITLYF